MGIDINSQLSSRRLSADYPNRRRIAVMQTWQKPANLNRSARFPVGKKALTYTRVGNVSFSKRTATHNHPHFTCHPLARPPPSKTPHNIAVICAACIPSKETGANWLVFLCPRSLSEAETPEMQLSVYSVISVVNPPPLTSLKPPKHFSVF